MAGVFLVIAEEGWKEAVHGEVDGHWGRRSLQKLQGMSGRMM